MTEKDSLDGELDDTDLVLEDVSGNFHELSPPLDSVVCRRIGNRARLCRSLSSFVVYLSSVRLLQTDNEQKVLSASYDKGLSDGAFGGSLSWLPERRCVNEHMHP